MTLQLHVAGATAEELACGIAAAVTVFATAGVTPHDAFTGYYLRELWDDSGMLYREAPTAAQMKAATVLQDAEAAAIEACCAGWQERPRACYLSLTEFEIRF